MSEAVPDDASKPGELPRGEEMLDYVQLIALRAVESKEGLSKEMTAAVKILSDVELKRMRLKQENDNASADREVIRAIGDHLRETHQNPFLVQQGAPDKEPPKPGEGPIAELEVSAENMSTVLGSPDYDEIMKRDDSE